MAHFLLEHFRFKHLPEGPVRETSAECEALARVMDEDLPVSDQKTDGLRHLLKAKDCFVRAKIQELRRE